METFEKFHGKLELDEKITDEIIEMEVWESNLTNKTKHYPDTDALDMKVSNERTVHGGG